MKTVVTGGAGFIGSHLVDRLLKDKHEVMVIDDLSTGTIKNVDERATLVHYDLAKGLPYYVKKHMESVDIVFHLAAFSRVEPSIQNPLLAHNINVNGTLNILKACRDSKVKRFVFTSSSAVYGNAENIPTDENEKLYAMSPYALHKQIGEQYCQLFTDLYEMETVILRYANVYGPRQPESGPYCNVMGIFAGQRLNKQPLTIVGDGTNSREYIHVHDVVNANIACINNKKIGKADIFNIGSGQEFSVNEIAKLIGGKTTNIPPRVEPKRTALKSEKAKHNLLWKPTINLKDWVKEYKKEIKL
tara:strand:- start:19156 stop:20061 length:906 start_codon:yes stop_codon:yes gene_type:complete